MSVSRTNLVGEWLFDTNASPTPDTSGRGNNGTLSATPPSWQQTGGYNSKGAYSFDGTNDYITTDTASVFDIYGTNPLTITVWFKTSQTPSVYPAELVIFTENGQGGLSFDKGIELNTSGKISMYAYDGAQKRATSIRSLNDGVWHFAVGTYDGISLKIFVDGVFNASTDSSSTYNFTIPKIVFSFLKSGNTVYFSGLIDDVRIYSSALSSSDIQKLYAEGKAKHAMAGK